MLAELALWTSAASRARDLHTEALAKVRNLGAHPEEARALEGIGNSHLHDGNLGQAAAYLEQALAIYQRIGALGARRVHETLLEHGLVPQPLGGSSARAAPREPGC